MTANIHVVTGIDHAGISHRREFPDTEVDMFEAEQYYLSLIAMARQAEARDQNWQEWPDRRLRPALESPKPKEANGDDHRQKPRSNLPPKRRPMPYQD